MNEHFKRINTINGILLLAEKEIFDRTGLDVQVIMVGNGRRTNYGWPSLLKVIANALGMTELDYKERNRQKDYVHLRYLAAIFLKQYFPNILLIEIKDLIGYNDHTDVVNAMAAGKRLLSLEDVDFCRKYNKVLEAVTQWDKE